MIHRYPLSRESDFSTELQLPVRLLKQVLTGNGVRLGGRILVAGCGRGDLVAFLDGIAYSVDAVDDCPDEVEAARRRFPHFQFHCAHLDELIPAPENDFDLILVQDLCVYRKNLVNQKTRSATANLLSCLRPGGELVFIRKQNTQFRRDSEHKFDCWKQHLACFPGQLKAHRFRESFFQKARWDWLAGRRNHDNYFTVSLQTPAERFPPAFWRDVARSGMLTGQHACCSIDQIEADIPRRAA